MYPFREGSFAVRNGWYVAAFANEVSRTPIGRTILGLPVALYRREDGTAVAVGGRCPHRHFPLGKSCLRGDDIVCGYHGISFGPDGRCTDIPSQSFIPGAYRIPTYPLVEHGMWLWIWPGDADKADPALLPDLADIGFAQDGQEPAPLFVNEVNCRYQLLNDNLLDLTHLAFLHGSSIGTIDNARVPEELSREPGVLRSRRYIMGGEPTPTLRETHGYHGSVDTVIAMDFWLPGLHAGFAEHRVSTGDRQKPGALLHKGWVFHAVTPATERTSTYFFGVGRAPGRDVETMRGRLAAIIEEDIFASEEIEKMLALVGGNPPELINKADRNAVEGRRALQALMDAEASAREVVGAAA